MDVPAGGKTEVAMRQRIGRGLRANKISLNVAFVVDFSDHWNSHTDDHVKYRLKIIQSTSGFAENIVADFNFDDLGFSPIVKPA